MNNLGPTIKPSEHHAAPSQSKRLDERRSALPQEVDCCGMSVRVERGVYQTSGDSELMVESVEMNKEENFLEIGCGTGIISLALASRASQGVGVDINDLAVANSKYNAETQAITNVTFFQSDVFEKVEGTFDVIICNPPYANHAVKDEIDRMFWDPEDEMKQRFFHEVRKYLKPNGRVYFGWADFADIDVNLPFHLAQANNLQLTNSYSKSHRGSFTFYVFEFQVAP